jgi:hypothetical protein
MTLKEMCETHTVDVLAHVMLELILEGLEPSMVTEEEFTVILCDRINAFRDRQLN